MSTEHSPWQQVAAQKKKLQNALLKPFTKAEASDDDITKVEDVSKLADEIAGGRLTAYDVTLAYLRRAAIVHEQTNCLTEIFFDDALARATELDNYLSRTGKTIGPLHGVPITLKDQFNVKGYDTTLGYVGRAFQPTDKDALLVKTLRDLGGIVIAKTNLPQSIMWCETENPLWGLTTNPRDPALTPGGSTGGEGVLLAEHGSICGWGTDIGGSVRIPAHMMGVYGFKPSSGRIPYEGVPVSTEGQEHVPSVVGPMARSLATIELVTRKVIESRPWEHDPTCHRLPWREDVFQQMQLQSRRLVVGLLVDDGFVKCHPSIDRVVKEAAIKLEKAGCTIVPWNNEGHTECIEIMDLFYTADGGEDIKRAVAAGGEPLIPHVEALVSRAPAISVYEYWQLNKRKRAAQKSYLEKWNAIREPVSGRNVDVLLTPVMPHPSVPHRACKWVGYTKVWNLLDYTALVIPRGKVDRALDLVKDHPIVTEYCPKNDVDERNWHLYDPVAMHDLPIGLQIVGQRLEEEKVLGAAKVIEQILGRDTKL